MSLQEIMSQLVKIEQAQENIAILTLNRPEKRNALNLALLNEICTSLEQLAENQRVVIIRGEGPIFCAGLDLQEMQDPEKTDQSTHAMAKLLSTVYHSSLVTIAVVHGAAYAGGAGMMACCDFVIAEKNTQFGFPETRRGLVPAIIMSILIRQLGYRRLNELLLFGEMIDAETAKEIGLINCTESQDHLISKAIHYGELALKGAPQATVKTKKLMHELSPRNFSEDLIHTIEYHHLMRQSSEAKEGTLAFLEKREPIW